MRLLHVAMTAGVIMAGLIGCASSHSKPRHSHPYPKQASSGAAAHHHAYPQATGHGATRSGASEHGHYHGAHHHEARAYHRPAPVPGRTPDGRYVLPGGLESVCAGGTPPPCQ